MEKSRESVSSVDRAIDVIEFIYQAGGECPLGEVAKGLGVSKSSVHRLLQTLKQRNFIYQDEKSGHYGLGTRLFVLGRMVGENMAFLKTVKPYADRLNARFGECVHVTVPYNVAGELPRQLLIGKIQNPASVLRVSPDVGAITYCHASASGKCMLAFGKPEVLARARGLRLVGFTERTITGWEELDRQLAEIRAQGYATEDGETENGLSCTAVPVLNRQGELCVVVSISGPTSRIRALDQQEIVEALKAVALEMENSIS
ncbi:MAG: IclR family transcriptional regulator [Clostridia bacterium]|nr:IclR family transcriptional regulator [Clostridia bacterium]